MMRAIPEIIEEIVGVNDASQVSHPFKYVRGPKRGFFCYTLSTKNKGTFVPATETELRRLIERGAFNNTGRVRMVPVGVVGTSGAGALKVVRYKGRPLPL